MPTYPHFRLRHVLLPGLPSPWALQSSQRSDHSHRPNIARAPAHSPGSHHNSIRTPDDLPFRMSEDGGPSQTQTTHPPLRPSVSRPPTFSVSRISSANSVLLRSTPASTPQRARQTATTNSCSSASASLGHHIDLESRSTPKHLYRGAAEAQKEVKGGDCDILTTIFIQEPSVYYKWTSYGHSLLYHDQNPKQSDTPNPPSKQPVQSSRTCLQRLYKTHGNMSFLRIVLQTTRWRPCACETCEKKHRGECVFYRAPPKRPIFSSRLGEADVLRLRDTLKAKKKSSPSFDTEAEPEEKPMRQNYTNAKTIPVPEATASSKPIENLSKDIISCAYCHRQHSWNHTRCECGRCHFHRPDLPPPQKCSKCNKCHREEKCKDFVEERAAENKRKVVHKEVKTGDPSRSPDLDDQPKKKSRKYTGEGTAGDPMAID
ncbi:hypothetical protein AUEXF2481DRAFT_31449 [Aureobasidium subglaciale EXF-2481]|uniref:Uncharacterized protein n=1 Tax=Aureobasidium subglaciale (strain EXF-2481) TaxID=1043005 RepID=A0A074Y6M7_AURSE|nr:uncharacterized protein AUEXF2481DRAFT_31449 [Aureobasidium subglaciale EXF-2481]KEQ93438.1 hypothetical protein AUEXF2481DRAFT_31449 [Aureobasidium subglaciale EXF-2481]